MLKMEIALDRELLEAQGYDWDTSYGILCKNFERVGFVKESFENGHLIYRGTGSDKDFSYFGLIAISLDKTDWFKKCVKHWMFFYGNSEKDVEDFIYTSRLSGSKGYVYEYSV